MNVIPRGGPLPIPVPFRAPVQPFHPNLTDELSELLVKAERTEEALVAEVKRLECHNRELKTLGIITFGALVVVSWVLLCLH